MFEKHCYIPFPPPDIHKSYTPLLPYMQPTLTSNTKPSEQKHEL